VISESALKLLGDGMTSSETFHATITIVNFFIALVQPG
jgi:hypothetical protein